MGVSIVVITDFEKEYWVDFFRTRKNKATVVLSIGMDEHYNERVEPSTSTKIEESIALKFEIGNDKTVVLAMQQNSNTRNEKIISTIINECLKDSERIAICAHENGGTFSVSNLSQIKSYKTFHHVYDDQVFENIKKLFYTINDKSFDEFWAFITPKPADIANLLRFEILCPLVALDLIMQAEENNKDTKIDENLKDQVKKAISDLTKNDKGEKNPIATLCDKYINCGELREKLNGLVNNTNRECSDYHSCLEDVAKKMEEQIAQLEP